MMAVSSQPWIAPERHVPWTPWLASRSTASRDGQLLSGRFRSADPFPAHSDHLPISCPALPHPLHRAELIYSFGLDRWRFEPLCRFSTASPTSFAVAAQLACIPIAALTADDRRDQHLETAHQ